MGRRRAVVRLGAVGLAAVALLTLVAPLAQASRPAGYFLGGDRHASIAAAAGGGVWTSADASGQSSSTVAPHRLGGAASGPLVRADHTGMLDDDQSHPVGSLAAHPSGDGFYLVAWNLEIQRYSASGEASAWRAADLVDAGMAHPLNGGVVMGAAMTPTGEGLWVVDQKGYVWSIGDAVSHGDASGFHDTPTGIVPTPSGRGYYIVLSDGTVVARGDAPFHGSTGGTKPNGEHVTGLAPYVDNGRVTGYWLVGEDGGVFSYGAAPFHGSTGGNVTDWVTSITSLPADATGRTSGYAIVHEDGDAELFTAAGHTYLNAPGTPGPR